MRFTRNRSPCSAQESVLRVIGHWSLAAAVYLIAVSVITRVCPRSEAADTTTKEITPDGERSHDADKGTAAKCLAAPQAYYLGWAEVAPIERGIEISFNPVDCNVCSFVVILPQENGVLVAHFDVPLIASGQVPEAQSGKIVARKAEFISKGTVLDRPNPPSLILLEEGGVLWLDGSSKRRFKPSELVLLTADSSDRLSISGMFDEVEVMTRRSLEADPFKVLESFETSVRELTADGLHSLGAANEAKNPLRVSNVSGRGNLTRPFAQGHRSGSLAIPTLARIYPLDNTNKVSVSGCCHLLLFYGLGPTDLPSFTSGDVVVKALTDEQAGVQAFGKSPFIRTRNGLRYLLSKDPVFDNDVGEAHQDQCLATFAALDLPLKLPIRLKTQSYSISDLLSESVANFSFDQKELAWTAIAFAKYLPPKQEWVNRFRERTSFSRLAQHLLQLDLNSQSCAGTHILQALVNIQTADRVHSILNTKTRKQLGTYVTEKLQEILRRQQADGSWSREWCDAINKDETGLITPLQFRILVTGHLLEVLNSLDSQQRPPNPVYLQAAEWVRQALNSNEIRPDGSLFCPFTHAARSAREIPTTGRTNSSSVVTLSTLLSGGVGPGQNTPRKQTKQNNLSRTNYEETDQ